MLSAGKRHLGLPRVPTPTPSHYQGTMVGAPQSVLICGWADGKWMVDLLRALVRPYLGRSKRNTPFRSYAIVRWSYTVACWVALTHALIGHALGITCLCCLGVFKTFALASLLSPFYKTSKSLFKTDLRALPVWLLPLHKQP